MFRQPGKPADTNELFRVLVAVDHAVADSGPHRNVVSSLNALSRREDVDLRVLCGEIDESAPFARNGGASVRLGFEPHNPLKLASNMARLHRAAADRDLVYIPTGLKSFLYAYSAKMLQGCRLVAGPNVTGIPWRLKLTDPGPFMTTTMSDAWIEMSAVRFARCVRVGTEPEQIDLVPHALDLERFHPRYADRDVWEEYGIDPDGPKLLYVGRFDERRKGTSLLFTTYDNVSCRVDNVDLVVVGPEGPLLDDDALARSDVHYLGPMYGDELSTLYASADAFVGTSLYETFWFTPLEAMASGTPPVVTRVGAVPRMIRRDGEQGFAVDIYDDDGRIRSDLDELLADRVVRLLSSPKRCEEMGEAARQRAEEAFSESRLGRQLVEVFRSVV